MAHEIIAADSETDPFKHGRIPAPFIWGAFNGSEFHHFKTTREFVEWVSVRDCIVYAHNGGRFDWHFLREHFEEWGDVKVIAGRMAKFKIGLAEFRDSYNILPVPLAAYQKDTIDYAIMEPDVRERHMPEIIDYLRGDCRYLWHLINDFISRYGLNLTLAGAAMKYWCSLSGEEKPTSSREFYTEFSKFYAGGRVQVFQGGIINTPFKLADINSAYPAAMMHRHAHGTQFRQRTDLPLKRASIERSFITLTGVSRGALPFRDKNGLHFPDDDTPRTYHVTGWEYLAGIETGTIDEHTINECYVFYESVDFVDYMTHFYEMKKDAKATDDKAGYIFAKLFMNSLYGKFAANPDKYEEFMFIPSDKIEAVEHEYNWKFAGDFGAVSVMCNGIPDHAKHFYNVATAASITGYVRAFMWRSIKQCAGVLYCDTDSIFARDTSALDLGTALGKWDIEATCSEGAFCGKKLYAVKKENGDFKTATKGGRLSPKEIYRIAAGETVTYKSDAPTFSVKSVTRFIERDFRYTA